MISKQSIQFFNLCIESHHCCCYKVCHRRRRCLELDYKEKKVSTRQRQPRFQIEKIKKI